MARMIFILLSILYTVSGLFAQERSNHINGILRTDFGIGVEGAKIIVTADDGSLEPLLVQTDASGHFTIKAFSKTASFQVKPQKSTDVDNGVDIWDLYLLSNAITTSQYESPYQKLASDINGDGELTAKDISVLRDDFLGRQKMPFSWRFYDGNCIPLLTNPFGICSQSVSYDEKLESFSFVGVKVGDLNNSVLANTNQIAEHIYGTKTLRTYPQKLHAGQEYDIDISIDGEGVVARQFSLNLGTLELLDVEISGISILKNIGVHQESNVVTFAQIGSEAIQSFTLRVRATDESELSEVLSLATDYSDAKLYDSDGELYGLQLAFVGESGERFMLYQNNPNPFGEVTNIRFYLPEASAATLTIFDGHGRSLKTVQTYCQKGMSSIPILKSDLNFTGIYFYKLVAGHQSAIRKMMLIAH